MGSLSVQLKSGLIDMYIKQSKAPALSRGIFLLRFLEDGRRFSLEELAAETGWPKASVLRIMDALCDCGAVRRGAMDKKFSALLRLAPVKGSQFSEHVRAALHRLAETSGQTAEWYEVCEDGLLLSDRCEPQHAEVRVLARLGYLRPWVGELEAAASCGLAERREFYDADAEYYVADGKGNNRVLSREESAQRIGDAEESGCCSDEEFNKNGVRRTACGIRCGGEFVGILAIAETYRPGNTEDRNRLKSVLKSEAGKLDLDH